MGPAAAAARAHARKIADIRRRGRLPILVGGSHYYVQTLLFPHSAAEPAEPADADAPPPVDATLAARFPIL